MLFPKENRANQSQTSAYKMGLLPLRGQYPSQPFCFYSSEALLLCTFEAAIQKASEYVLSGGSLTVLTDVKDELPENSRIVVLRPVSDLRSSFQRSALIHSTIASLDRRDVLFVFSCESYKTPFGYSDYAEIARAISGYDLPFELDYQ